MEEQNLIKLIEANVPDESILLISYRGSRHFNLHDEESDVDLRTYTMPLNTVKTSSIELDGIPSDIMSVQKIIDNPFTFFSLPDLEAITLPLFVKEDFEPVRQELLNVLRTPCANTFLSKSLFRAVLYYTRKPDDNKCLAKAYKFYNLYQYSLIIPIVDIFLKKRATV